MIHLAVACPTGGCEACVSAADSVTWTGEKGYSGGW